MQDGADNVIYIMLPFLSLLESYNLLHWKKINEIRNSAFSNIPKLAEIAILIELSFIYFFGAISKLGNPYWLDGESLYYILRVDDFRTSFLNVELTKSYLFVKFSTYLTLAWELSFGLLIWWSKRLRYFYIVTGIMLHLGIWLFMRIDNFSFVMISLYPILIYDSEFRVLSLKLTHSRLILFLKDLKNN